MDIANLLTVIFKLIDEMRLGKRSRKEALIRQETTVENLYEDVSDLIDKFRQTVEEILKILEKAYPKTSIHRSEYISCAEFTQANRRLFEIYSDMRIVTQRFSGKLTKLGYEKVKPLSEICLQLTDIEGMIGVEIASQTYVSFLPLTRDGLKQFYEKNCVLEGLPFQTGYADEYVLNMCIYFNTLLLKLQNCKERLRIIIDLNEDLKKYAK